MSDANRITIFIDASAKDASLANVGDTDGRCPTCGGELAAGFGLAGGGYGPYEYCPAESCGGKIVTKTECDE